MEGFYIVLLLFTLALETAAAVLLLRRAARLERRLEALRAHFDSRLGALERAIAELESEYDAAPESRADDREKAREAERRFTEGVANILSFNRHIGRKGE